MRWLVCLALMFAGCVGSIPDDPTITADLACEASRMLVQLQQDAPPAPAGQCENCGGTGKIGDGRIVMECPVCHGTGKK